MVCTLKDPTWTPGHIMYLEQLSQLGLTTRSIVPYLLWTSRNKLHFENQVPLNPSAACYTVYAPFGAHFRSLLRVSSHLTHSRMLKCLQCLRISTRLGRIIRGKSRLFNIRIPALYLNSSGRLREPPPRSILNI
ncbi:hypothetical protein PHMEG_00025793 [Phytophthora megakarya]|uniref:Uncharacterized protein n=1 Tax=Phytophthora megakarya TaxID=4795 RepID=A0A225VCW0_9STRA|nr:hypothetical protein PHMEG_00025793 [Phytophthora megakarya]